MTLSILEFQQSAFLIINAFITMHTNIRAQTLFVGVDVHKESHTAVGLTPFGDQVFEMTLGNHDHDFTDLLTRAQTEASALQLAPRFGLEDVHSWGERLSSFLCEANQPVVAVAPVLVDHARKRTTHPEKNDSLDARGVAQVMIQRIDTLPAYTVTDVSRRAKQIQELSCDREYLVKERARLKNQLHVLLYRIHNCDYKKVFKDPFAIKALRHWLRSVPKNADVLVVRRMKRTVRRLQALREEITELEQEMAQLIKAGGYTLPTMSGCGVVLAGEIIGEIGDIARFTAPGALAKYAGCAPRQHSSGQTVRWRKTRSGNRRLNRAFHRVALSQISCSGNPAAKAYFQKKIGEGKTKAQALVCLRRQLVTVAWMLLKHGTEYRYPQENA
jgi:transposase